MGREESGARSCKASEGVFYSESNWELLKAFRQVSGLVFCFEMIILASAGGTKIVTKKHKRIHGEQLFP